MKYLVLTLMLLLGLLFAGPVAMAQTTPSPTALLLHAQQNPLPPLLAPAPAPAYMTYEELEATCSYYLGLNEDDTWFVATHNAYYYSVLSYVAQLEGRLPYRE